MAFPDPALPAADDAPHVSWHALPADAVAQQLGVDCATGLSAEEVARRQALHGLNLMSEKPAMPAWQRFVQQLVQPLVLVLLAAGAITAALGEWTDASVIFAVVLVNALIGYWQEAKAEGALAALAKTICHTRYRAPWRPPAQAGCQPAGAGRYCFARGR